VRAATPRELRALLLDFDHTLADLGRWVDWRTARDRIQEVYRRAGVDALQEMRRRGALSPMVALDAALAGQASPERAAEIRAEAFRILEEQERAGAARTGLLPGTAELIDFAAGHGLALGIVSANAASAVGLVLERLGIERAFAVVVGRTLDRPLKPAPDMFQAALGTLACGPEAALAIGDSRADIAGALAAGIEAVGVLGGEADEDALFAAGAAWVVESLAVLPALLAFWAAAGHEGESGI
jgi:HAD superfamily hydrolase (TIGR01509 family)